MLNFRENDIKEFNDLYKRILFNLKTYLQHYNMKNELEYSKIIINMLHNGAFSMNKIAKFDSDYDYLGLPHEISQGVHVMYGIYCCRHAAEFLYDILTFLNFNPDFVYFFVDDAKKTWHKVNLATEEANHQAVLCSCKEKYIIDPANKLILQDLKYGVKSLDIKSSVFLKPYQDDNIARVGRVLKKYYHYKELGIENI